MNPSRGLSVPPSRGRKAKSCHLCNRRKVRCDRRVPSCSSCSRAGKQCVYPAPRSVSRESTRDTSPSHGRSQCSQLEPDNEAFVENQASEASNSGSVKEVLVQRGPVSQYFDETLHFAAVEEGHDSPASPNHQAQQPQRPRFSEASAWIPFMAPIPLPIAELYPSKSVASALWSTYVDNVESCSNMKILHLPTEEIRFFTALDDPSKACPEDAALSFAIYFASLNSLTIRGAVSSYHAQIQDPAYDLHRFKAGVEQSLAMADFMNKPSTVTLKALAIYLAALRVSQHGASTWALNGLAIRLSQSIGLHRDGEQLGLSPFESEVRRRLWWHFVIRDCRSGEDQGLQNIVDLASTSNVGEPLNCDDIDISPEMQVLPQERQGFTSITFTKVNVAFAKAQRQLSYHLSPPAKSPSDFETVRARIIAEMVARVDGMLIMCNLAIPRHRLLIRIAKFVQHKLDFTSRLQVLIVENPKKSTEAVATDGNLGEAISLLEKFSSILTDEALEPYVWSTMAYPQSFVLLYVLWHLCVRPESPVANRAWEVLGSICTSIWDSVRQTSSSIGSVMDTLRTKAALARDNGKANGDANADNTVEGGLEDTVSHTGPNHLVPLAANQSSLNNFERSGMLFDGDLADFPDWTTISQSLDWGTGFF